VRPSRRPQRPDSPHGACPQDHATATRTRSRRTRAALLAVAGTLAVVLAPAARAADPASDPSADFGSFNSVLGVGEGQNANALDLARFEATGTAPTSFTNQERQYSDIEKASFEFSATDFSRFYKPSGFGALPGGLASTEFPQPGLRILRDAQFSVPRIYGATRPEVMWGAGYATGEDRLFFMDVLRHMAEGRMTELLGPSAAAGDSAQLGQQNFSDAEYTQQLDSLPQRAGIEGAQALSDIRSYISGINTFIAQARMNPAKLPAEYPALGVQPRTWTEADTTAVAVFLIAQFTVSGGGQPQDAEIMDLLAQQHPQQAAALYNDFRQLRDPETPLVADRSFPYDDPGTPTPGAVALLDPGSVAKRNAVIAGGRSAAGARSTSLPAWAQPLAAPGLGLPPRESNAVLISASHSLSGHPLASMGPQVGYYSPEIFLEYELHGGGIDVSGVAFPGAAPYPLIGHGRDFAWTGTTANGGNEDVFAEQLCNLNGSPASTASSSYLYRGRCVAFEQRDQTDTPPVSPTSPGPPSPTVTLRALRSVHGPVESFATVHGQPVALTVANATDQHAVQSSVSFMRLAENQVHDAPSFIDAFSQYTGNENWFYADDRDIAWFESGWFPRHAPGSSRDLPIWGTGPYDWQGFDPATYSYARMPDETLPREINPPEGYLVSWNNKEVPNWPAPGGTWSFGPAERAQLLSLPLQSLLATHPRVDLAQVTQVTTQAATRDLRGQVVLPELLKVIGADPDPRLAPLLAALRQWQSHGALRVDLTGSNVYGDSPAIALIDAWWPRLVRAMFQPALGASAFTAISDKVNPYDERPNDSGFFNGWQSYVDKDLRDLLASVPTSNATLHPTTRRSRRHPRARHHVRRHRGHPQHRRAAHRHQSARRTRGRHHRYVRLRHRRAHLARHARLHLPGVSGSFSQLYCGGGSLSACRGLLVSTLLAAADAVRAQQGPDPAQWKVFALCPVPAQGRPSCDEEVPITAGAISVPPFPFQNRGTFHQAVEVMGHRPR